jgi:hypothetical protein
MVTLTNAQRITNLETKLTSDEGRVTVLETNVASVLARLAAVEAAINVTPPIDPPPPPPPPPPSPTPGALTGSGPVQSQYAGQIIEWLDITAPAGTGVAVSHDNVTVRNCRIKHGGGPSVPNAHGIRVSDCKSPKIQNNEIIHTGPFNSTNPRQSINVNRHNIELENVTAVSATNQPLIDSNRLVAGSRQIYVLTSPCAGVISNAQMEDSRGLPNDEGGNNIQFDKSPGWFVRDFSCRNSSTSFTEDNINSNCANITIQRGRIHYNNSPSGVGILLEFGASNCLIEDVDCTQMGNGAFSGVQVANATFRRCRTRDSSNVARDGRAKPDSNSLSFAATGGPIYYRACKYFALANPGNLLWQASAAPAAEIASEDFTPRAFLDLWFPWKAAAGA